jgi:hypothetical protein
MVKVLKNKFTWMLVLLSITTLCSIASKWVPFLDVGIFNYSVLLLISLIAPNLSAVYKEIDNSEVQSIKLPFCELRLLKKYDYYFLGERTNDEVNNDIVVLAFYNNVLNLDEAKAFFESDYPDQSEMNITEVIKQVHYKNNDQ